MKKVFLFASAIALCSSVAIGQTKTKAKKNETKNKAQSGATGFSITESGLEYKIVKDVAGNKKPGIGDHVEMHINTHVGDSALFNSRTLNNNQPVPFQLAAPAFQGDLVEGFMMMTPGDSAIFRVSVDSLKKAGAQLMPWMKEGDKIEYEVVMVSVKTEDEVKTEAALKAGKQIAIDDSLIQDYIKKNNIKAVKTPSGMYYKIHTLGTGEMAKTGQQVTVNYTGKTLDGNAFDSNIDPKYNHVEPFMFILGSGQVIKGWDEGLGYFNKGAKGTLFIPSGMAYGERSPTPAIPSSSVLIFDVEMLNVDVPPVRMEAGKREGKDHDHGHDHGSHEGHQH